MLHSFNVQYVDIWRNILQNNPSLFRFAVSTGSLLWPECGPRAEEPGNSIVLFFTVSRPLQNSPILLSSGYQS